MVIKFVLTSAQSCHLHRLTAFASNFFCSPEGVIHIVHLHEERRGSDENRMFTYM